MFLLRVESTRWIQQRIQGCPEVCWGGGALAEIMGDNWGGQMHAGIQWQKETVLCSHAAVCDFDEGRWHPGVDRQ